jgi:hypothetical protein
LLPNDSFFHVVAVDFTFKSPPTRFHIELVSQTSVVAKNIIPLNKLHFRNMVRFRISSMLFNALVLFAIVSISGAKSVDGVDADYGSCFKRCSDDKSACEAPCGAAKKLTQAAATCLMDCKHAFKTCADSCDEEFPLASKAAESADARASNRLGPPSESVARTGSGMSFTMVSQDRFDSAPTRYLRVNPDNSEADEDDSGEEYEDEVDAEDPDGRRLQTGILTVQVLHDNYPLETAWSLKRYGRTIGSQRRGSVYTRGRLITRSFRVTPGRYQFDITDSDSDGICCLYGYGYWALYLNGNLLIISDFVDGYGERTTFTLS